MKEYLSFFFKIALTSFCWFFIGAIIIAFVGAGGGSAFLTNTLTFLYWGGYAIFCFVLARLFSKDYQKPLLPSLATAFLPGILLWSYFGLG